MWQWYETAAVQGDARAQTNLGVRYQNGQGMPEDSVRAYMWYSLAATHSPGDAQRAAAKHRTLIARLMLPRRLPTRKNRRVSGYRSHRKPLAEPQGSDTLPPINTTNSPRPALRFPQSPPTIRLPARLP
jgi:hypothetical protein